MVTPGSVAVSAGGSGNLPGYSLTVNGESRVVEDALPTESLLFVLRERLGLAGSKNACEQGECGSCSVLVDGVLVCACLELAAAAQGCDIVTVEGLAGLPGQPATAGDVAGLAGVGNGAVVASRTGALGEPVPGAEAEGAGAGGPPTAATDGDVVGLAGVAKGAVVASGTGALGEPVPGAEANTAGAGGSPTSATDDDVVGLAGVGNGAVGEAGLLTDVQAAMVDAGGVQCGFCTPGFVVAIHDLLARDPDPDRLVVREALAGNLCRCTGYGRIVAAVEAVVASRAGRPVPVQIGPGS